ncbi:dienelactone hydrolase family protein [Micromonospora sp. WMMA1363]|uniref:alpha/beta hydrolase family protein n=1 Tax=Micromonospora sp. WMMA1363 TaxID=3053985 RepID=UPI00259CF2CB|nr:dienelactone hydrolase family protein [Micromonospora sp. WMMA1363]MDM4722853.1 dienelactone hydrolase family protein [Micromonospora sp. WMMA1363]
MLRWFIVGATALALVLPAPLGASAGAAASDPGSPGDYAAGYVDTVVSAAGRSFSARVYYPATASGAGQPVAAGRFPALAFGPGPGQATSRYHSTLGHLASWGFIVVAPDSHGRNAPSHSAFADDLNTALDWLVAQHTTSGSRFAWHVSADRLGLSGHSTGGGASLLAAARNPRVTTVAGLAAVETNPSAMVAAATLTIPVQLISAERDSVATISGHQRPIYDSKPSAKQLRTIRGGCHCGFLDRATPTCESGSINRATQLRLARRLLTQWFLRHLAGDPTYDEAIWGTPAQTDPAVAFEGMR